MLGAIAYHRAMNDEPARSPIELLDAAIAEMEAARAEALRPWANARGAESEAIALALKRLDEQLAKAREKRAALVARMARIDRMRELTAASKALRAELDALGPVDENDPRREALRRRAAVLREEMAAMKDPPRS